MKEKAFIYWIVGGIALLLTLGFIKYEMAANRRALSEDIKKAIREAPQSALGQLSQTLTNGGVNNLNLTGNVQNVLGSLAGLAADAEQRASQILTNRPAATPNQTPQGGDLVQNVFNLASEAGRKVDTLALQATELSIEDEIELGRQLDKQVLAEMKVADDPANALRLQTLAKPLVSQCSRKQIPYTVRLVKSQVVTAFSLAGGYVYITTAFLKRFSTDPELAMTLGHEIGHIDLKHSVHKVQYYYHGRKILGQVAEIGQLFYSILSSPYSKDQEYQADAWGFTVCKKAGWESGKVLQIFDNLEKYEQEEQAKDGAKPASDFERMIGDYFASHPKTADRRERLKQMQN